MRSWWLFLVLLVGSLARSAETTRVYGSPDGAVRAVVETSSAGESRTTVRQGSGRVLVVRDGRSRDGAHGEVVLHATWTRDSQFLVVSTAASGGHQPWARPIWMYSRVTGRIVELARLGVTPTGDFTLAGAGRLRTRIRACAGSADRAIEVNLRDLREGVAIASCADRPGAHER